MLPSAAVGLSTPANRTTNAAIPIEITARMPEFEQRLPMTMSAVAATISTA